MAMIIEGPDELKKLAGEHIGTSEWFEVTPDLVDSYGQAIGASDWIHSELDRSDENGVIVPGFLTLSLVVPLWLTVLVVENVERSLNYGLNRIRFPHLVTVGSRVRLDLTLVGAKDVTGGVEAMYEVVMELQGSDKPACVAQCLFRYYRKEENR